MDYTDKYTEQQAEAYARQINKIYEQAAREVRQKLADFQKRHEAISKNMLADVASGKITMADYKKWLKGQVFQGNQWKQKLKDITDTYVHADAKARELLNGTSRNVFTEAANYTAYDIEKGTSGAVSFNLYDKPTVERLIKDNPKMLPEWKIDQPKDYIWNEKRVQNAVLQGIIQGESIGKIGKRLESDLATSNAKKMNMFARTAVTGAQNAGRMERLHETKEMGIDVKKKWICTHDDRVRDTHIELDGQEQDVDKPFEVDGMEIMYPADPTAEPELTYNCRCSMTYIYPKYRDIHSTDHYRSYKDWKAGK